MAKPKVPDNVVEFPPPEDPIGNISAESIRDLNDYELVLLNLEVSKIQIERLAGKR